MPTASSRSRSSETDRERERAAARKAEKELWDRTRGAGSSVLRLLESNENAGRDREWTAQEILPALIDIEHRIYEPVEAPSADQLLSGGITDYTILPKVLGKGKFSTVFIASKDGKLSAIKHTALFPHHQLIATRLLREPTLLAELPPHPNLVEVKETIQTAGHFYLVEEYLDGYVTLEALIPKVAQPGREFAALPLSIADLVLSQLLLAVRAIHHPLQVCHRDIKPENILVHAKTFQLKLLDFGLATHFSRSEPKLTTCCGSPAFHCPEIVKALANSPGSVSYWGPEVDAWTCGVTMLRVLTGVRYPLGSSHSSQRSMAIRAQQAVAQIPLCDEVGGDESLGRRLRDKVAKLLDMDSVKRMRNFEEMAVEKGRELEPQGGTKNFKSTTFIPTTASHKMDLPLLNEQAAESFEDSVPQSAPHISGCFRDSQRSLASSQRTTPAGSRAESPVRERHTAKESSQESSSRGTKTPVPHLKQKSRLVMLNPTNQAPQRILSYIKYCLRCAGILYHCWADVEASASLLSPWVTASSTSTLRQASLDIPRSPTAPVPSSVSGERSDGWAHVHIFQCVIDFTAVKQVQQEPQSVAKGFVQSLMAAFGRKTSTTKENSPQRGRSPSRQSVTSRPASVSLERDAGVKATSDGKAASGDAKFLPFYMCVKFPKLLKPLVRRAHSRSNTLQGRRSRASSATATTLSSQAVAVALLSEQSGSRKSQDLTGTSTSQLAAATSTAELSVPRPNQSTDSTQHLRQRMLNDLPSVTRSSSSVASANNRSGARAHHNNSFTTPIGLTIDTLTPSSSDHRAAHSKTSTDFSSGRRHGRPPSRQSRGLKGKVFIEVNDERALDALRAALSVGGTRDKSDSEESLTSTSICRTISTFGEGSGEHGRPYDSTARHGRLIVRKLGPRSQSYAGPRNSRPGGQWSLATENTSPVSAGHKLVDADLMSRKRANTDYKGSSASDRGRFLSADLDSEMNVAVTALHDSKELPAVESNRGQKPFRDWDADSCRSASTNAQVLPIRSVGHVHTVVSACPIGVSPVSEESTLISQLQKTEGEERCHFGTSEFKRDLTALQASVAQLSLTQALETSSFRDHLADQRGTRTEGRVTASRLFKQVQALHLHLLHETVGVTRPDKTALFDEHFFEIFEALMPITGLAHNEKASRCATECLSNLTLRASPKEGIIAIQERLETISRGRTTQGRADGVSVDVSNQPAELQFPTGVATSTGTEHPIHWKAENEILELLDLLKQVLVRITTKKPALYLEPLVSTIPQSLLVATGRASPEAVSHLLNAALTLLQQMAQWAAVDSPRAYPQLASLLMSVVLSTVPSIIQVGGRDEESPAEYMFLQYNPNYRIRSVAPQARVFMTHNIELLRSLFRMLNVNAFRIAAGAYSGDSGPKDGSLEGVGADKDLEPRLGALVSLSLLFDCTHDALQPSMTHQEILSCLHSSLALLMVVFKASIQHWPEAPKDNCANGSDSARGSSSSRDALLADSGLSWIMFCLQELQGVTSVETQRAVLPEETLYPLVNMLGEHAALSPYPPHRHISLHLLNEILSRYVQEELVLVGLLKDIVSDSPWMQLRIAGIALVKDRLVERFNLELEMQVVSRWREFLITDVFTLPSPAAVSSEDKAISKASLEAYWTLTAPWLLQNINLAYLLFKRHPHPEWLLGDGAIAKGLCQNLVAPVKVLIAEYEGYLKGCPRPNGINRSINDVALVKQALASLEEVLSGEDPGDATPAPSS